MERYIKVARTNEIQKRKGKLVLVEGRSIALLNSNGAFFAVDDPCPFDGGSLSDGSLNGSVVECPGDKAEFFIPTGECLWARERRGLRTYRLRIDKDDIFVDIGQDWMPNKGEEGMVAGFQPDAMNNVGVL